MLDKVYLPASESSNIQKKKQDVQRFYVRRKLIENLYNPLQKVLKHDPDNLMYNVYTFPDMTFDDVYGSNYDDYFTSLDCIQIERTNTIYYPMHLIPEAYD